MARVLITGANGWIGSALCRALLDRGDEVWGLTRRRGCVPERVQEWLHEPADFAGLDGEWPAERGFDALVHLAARVHSTDAGPSESAAAYARTNAIATVRLAELARERGVARFVFLSSVKALGETDHGHPWRETDTPEPSDAYGQSKRSAEMGLAALSGIETVVLRPPLVYGPGVRANFARLLHAVRRGWPLPLGCATAQRSLVYIENLVDALVLSTRDGRAAGRLFHVADAELLSVCELVTRMGELLGRPAHLIAVPVPWLQGIGRWLGRGAEVGRLTDTLRLDTGLIHRTLGWRAPISAAEGLERTVAWYRTTW